METKEFEIKKEKWLQEVADGCHEIAIKNENYPDFYVFQSQIFENPDLLNIGANPAGNETYKDMLQRKQIERRTKDDLINSSDGKNNEYISNPDWAISKPILEMFSGKRTREVLENAVIMNAVYFNTKKVEHLGNFKEDKKVMKDFCSNKTLEFIKDICKPKNILFIGKNAPEWLKIKFHHIDDSVCRTSDGKNYLVVKKYLNEIPCYIIHHTSMNKSFNTGENLQRKKEFFEKVFE